jgi:hypothetical protein
MTTQHSTTAPQIAVQPVSLVKSAPTTYCTAGHPAGLLGIHRNDLRLLHWAIGGGTL